MIKVHYFVAGLVRSAKSATEIKTNVDAMYRDKALGLTSVYFIIKKVKAGGKYWWPAVPECQGNLAADIATVVTADMKEDRRANCRDLVFDHGVSNGTIHNILWKDLGLVKKSARWVPKLLSQDQNQDSAGTCKEFVTTIKGHSMAMLNYIVTVNEMMVSLTTHLRQKISPDSG
jgi:hypothetical protein